jgi:tight adherence protein C
MTLLLLALLGAGVGLGLALLGLGTVVRARPQLTDALNAPHREPTPARTKPTGLIQRIGAPIVDLLLAVGLPSPAVRADLRALDQPVEEHLARQAGFALIAAVPGPVYGVAAATVQLKIPPPILTIATLLLAASGYLLPSRVVHTQAGQFREQIRYATSALLDLVAVMLAAGAGQEEAFTLAAQAGTGTGHDQLRAALGAARTTRTPIWDELAALGRRTDVPELTELAATSLLAGTEGAQIRDTLTTKAASLRTRLLATAEAQAASATERMSLPTVLLMTAFLIFTCYPALAQVMKSL